MPSSFGGPKIICKFEEVCLIDAVAEKEGVVDWKALAKHAKKQMATIMVNERIMVEI